MIKENINNNAFRHPIFVKVFLIAIFLSALFIRLYHITEPLMDFHPTRQYHSATIARCFFYNNNPEISEQIKYIAKENCPRIIEPPTMEVLSSAGYKLFNKDVLWLPRIYSILFWMIGGLFLYLTVKLLLGFFTATLSLLYYFFLPFTILASRSFQPEPLMVMLVIAGIYYMVIYFNAPSMLSLGICSLVCCFAVLQKPNSVFVISVAFAALGLHKFGFRKFLLDYKWLLFCIIAFLPAFLFYGYRIFISGALQSQTGTQFIADLYFKGVYWLKWLNMIGVVTGFIPFFIGIFGLIIMPRGLAKSLCLGIFAGYFLMGLVFNYAIHTHSYYHLIFLPWLGVCFSYGILYCLKKLAFLLNSKLKILCAVSSIFLLFGLFLWKAPALKNALGKRSGPLHMIAKLFCGHQKIEFFLYPNKSIVSTAKEIGEIVEHSQSVLFISKYYAAPLKYHGFMSGKSWPRGGDFYRSHLVGKETPTPDIIYKDLSENSMPDYIVVTNFNIFHEQKYLKSFLDTNFKKYIQTDHYLIYVQND